ncbi:MAG: phenylalanine--tRNA ligase subunit alpha [Phycisphaerae bacterium]|nr:phenylalanine--tRNA ligase subunit alpha [Phycisphaerae bacterium]
MSSDLDAQLQAIRADGEQVFADAATLEALKQAEARVLGKKGPLAALFGRIRECTPEQRGPFGQRLNEAKAALAERAQGRRAELEQSAAAADLKQAQAFDPTLPPPVVARGSVHPVTYVQWEVEDVFERLGFSVVAGPEMETEYYNFEALNIPAMHPARDMQDTFWLTSGMLLRTHTSPCQVRAMERFGPPLRVIAPGRCFRYETIDASHENTFFQLEGLMIDRHISIANLIGIMKLLLREIFKRDVKVRLRPGYFPFVEPGFELDMSCSICDGAGCATCKRSGWVEILPCGMVHPNVLRFGGIDPHEYTGFAFGLGLTRLAMMKYGVGDIRVLNSGDLRPIVYPEKFSGTPITMAE